MHEIDVKLFSETFQMAFKNHSPARIREIKDRFSAIADTLESIAKEMDEIGCESISLQSESVLNHRLLPIEDWIYRIRGDAEKQLRKRRREREAFLLGQQYAAEKAAAEKAEKPAKSPGKRKK